MGCICGRLKKKKDTLVSLPLEGREIIEWPERTNITFAALILEMLDVLLCAGCLSAWSLSILRLLWLDLIMN